MKKIIFAITVIMVAILTAGCTHITPKTVVKAYVKAIQKGNAEKAADCFYYEGTDEEKEHKRSTMVSLCQKGILSMQNEHDGIKSYEIVSVDKEDDKATVHVVMIYTDGAAESKEIHTIRKGFKWYLDSNK